MPTPTTAAASPATRKVGAGTDMTVAIIRFNWSGNRAYIKPSITRTRANAVTKSVTTSIRSAGGRGCEAWPVGAEFSRRHLVPGDDGGPSLK